MVSSFLLLFGVLVFFHFLADYPLQGDFLARAKNRAEPIPHVPWWQAMTAHCFIHAGLVFLATGNAGFFVMEFVVHFTTDYRKCQGELTFNKDQAIHIFCKACYAFIIVAGFANG